jgi:hypothetical protein
MQLSVKASTQKILVVLGWIVIICLMTIWIRQSKSYPPLGPVYMGAILKELNNLSPPSDLAVQSNQQKAYKDSFAEVKQTYLINYNVQEEVVVNYYRRHLEAIGWRFVQSEPADDVSPWACKDKIGLYFIRSPGLYVLYLRWSWVGEKNGPCK